MEKDYISVQEFAELVDLTQQAIYKKINSKKNEEFKKFIKEIEGKKYISKAAAKLFKPTVEQQLNKSLETVEQQFNNRLKQQENEYNLRSEFYEKQLADRDEQIAFLKEQLAKRDEELVAQRTLTENAQKLQLIAESKIAAIEDKSADENKSIFSRIFRKA
jgi:predicted transcriptional regulator